MFFLVPPIHNNDIAIAIAIAILITTLGYHIFLVLLLDVIEPY